MCHASYRTRRLIALRREASADEIRATMEKHRGVREKVWRELGLPNRYVLQRLIKRHGLQSQDRAGQLVAAVGADTARSLRAISR